MKRQLENVESFVERGEMYTYKNELSYKMCIIVSAVCEYERKNNLVLVEMFR